MEHRPEMILSAVIKSLRDNVVPAVDAANPGAQQQMAISLALLEILQSRLPLMYRYDRHDLAKFVDLAESLNRELDRENATLSATSLKARAVLDRARADPEELLQALHEIRDSISAFLVDAQEGGDRARVARLRRLVVDSAQELILRERAFVAPFGFEADPDAVPDIVTLLDPV